MRKPGMAGLVFRCLKVIRHVRWRRLARHVGWGLPAFNGTVKCRIEIIKNAVRNAGVLAFLTAQVF
jgi:hypothetical protein